MSLAALLTAAPVAAAEPTTAELLQRLEEQEQKILVLERRLELEEETDQATASSAAVARADSRGFSIRSADSRNQVRLRGVLHFDGGNFVGVIPWLQARHPPLPRRRHLGGIRAGRPL